MLYPSTSETPSTVHGETEYAKQDDAEMEIRKELDNPMLDPELREKYNRKTSALGRVEPHAAREARLALAELERLERETAAA